MILGRLGDIGVDDFWNPFFQKCWGASAVSENDIKTSNELKIYLLG